MSVLAPGAVVGGCRIEGVVGRGGMGVVYLARQLELERDVALKVISPELTEDPIARGRFLAEARAAAAVEHPNVVPVHSVGTDDDLAYLVMRLIRGDDLRTVVRRDGPLAPERAAAITERIGDALDAIHRAGYVHRDVKPPNVLIDDDGHVYLSDFGLAKAALATRGPTSADHWVGTLDYVAPEQIRGEVVSARTDVYALGGVLHFMLTGLPPYVREGDEAKLWAHLHDPPPIPSGTPGVPAGFDTIVARALAKDPADRYPSAGELGRDSLAVSHGDNPTAITVRARRLSSRRERHWRAVAALGAAAAVGAVAALLLTGDPAPEGSEPPTAEASPTATPEPSGQKGPKPALTKIETLRHVSNRPDELAVEDRNLWITASSRSHPVWFKLSTGDRPPTQALGRGASALVTDRGTVWIAYKTQNRVVHLDARSGAFLGQIDTALGPTALAVGSTGLWIATQDRRDDPATLLHYTRDGISQLPGMPIDNGVADMVHGGGSMWMAIQDTRTIRRFNADLTWRVATDIPALPSDLAWGQGRLWVLSGGRILTRFDPVTKDSSHEDIPSLPGRVAISGGLAVVALPTQDRLFLVDARTLDPERKAFVRAPGGPYGVATHGRDVYVTAQNDHAVIHYRR